MTALDTHHRRRVVVTGLGFVTPIGNDAETVWHNAIEGVSGVGLITQFDTEGFPTRIAAEVKDFDPTAHIERKAARHMARYTQFSLVATMQALAQSRLDPASMEPDDVGVLIATGVGGIEVIERNHSALRDRGVRAVSPFTVPMMIADMASGVVAMHCHAGGPNFSIVSACASSANGLGEAAEIIKRGDAVAMIAGGAEATITPLTIGAFCQAQALSQRNDEPEKASRPWDVDRDGFVLGEGAVMMVLEEMEHARGRGAPILAELRGYGASDDMYHATAPDPAGGGAARALRKAITRAEISPEDVDYVNAHGTSTQLGDVAETRAIKAVFGEHAQRLAISSTKSVHAHMLGAAGAMEAALCVLTLQHGMIPPTANLDTPGPECDLDYVPKVARKADVRVAVSNSFGFGGHNASLVIARP